MVSERSRASGRPLRQPIAPGLRPVERTSGIAADFADLGQAMPGLLVQNLGQVIYLLTCPSVVLCAPLYCFAGAAQPMMAVSPPTLSATIAGGGENHS